MPGLWNFIVFHPPKSLHKHSKRMPISGRCESLDFRLTSGTVPTAYANSALVLWHRAFEYSTSTWIPSTPSGQRSNVPLHTTYVRTGGITHWPFRFHLRLAPLLRNTFLKYEIIIAYLLSTLFSNPSSSPSLNALAFLECDLGEGFVG